MDKRVNFELVSFNHKVCSIRNAYCNVCSMLTDSNSFLFVFVTFHCFNGVNAFCLNMFCAPSLVCACTNTNNQDDQGNLEGPHLNEVNLDEPFYYFILYECASIDY